jgi:hypothetical protein
MTSPKLSAGKGELAEGARKRKYLTVADFGFAVTV